jgi:hypothetical protein
LSINYLGKRVNVKQVIALKYSQPVWKMVLDAAKEIGLEVFTAGDIVTKVHETKPDIPTVSIRTYVIGLAPNHPSSKFYPSTREQQRYFDYLGDGKFKLKGDTKVDTKIVNPPIPPNGKEAFLLKYKESIIVWAEKNKDALISGRREFGWSNKSLIDALTERNQISKALVQSRIRNNGGIDIETINNVMNWGGLRKIQLENNQALEITREAFTLLDNGDLKGAALKLLSINGVGIASATKIIGLFDQTNLAIYDSRVGTALRTLEVGGKRLVKCPAGRTRPGDLCSEKEWASDYEKLIWILEVIRNWLNEQGYPFNIADVEMALFMLGK